MDQKRRKMWEFVGTLYLDKSLEMLSKGEEKIKMKKNFQVL